MEKFDQYKEALKELDAEFKFDNDFYEYRYEKDERDWYFENRWGELFIWGDTKLHETHQVTDEDIQSVDDFFQSKSEPNYVAVPVDWDTDPHILILNMNHKMKVNG